MGAELHICTTCDRYADPIPAPTRGETLARAVEALGGVALRRVDCLDGCLRPCNAALRSRGKPFHRLSGLGPEDALALVRAAQIYAADPGGRLDPVRAGVVVTTRARGR